MTNIYETIFNSVNDGILICSSDGRFLKVNRIMCDDLGYSEGELLQLGASGIVIPESRDSMLRQVGEAAQKGGGLVEIECVCKDGSLVPVELNIRPIGYMDEPAILIVARNIVERKETENALIHAKLLAEKSNRIKSEFLANMSHELRTPLNSIIGFSQLLNVQTFGDLNEKQIGYVANIHKSGKHLLELINDILDISKIESGNMKYEPDKINLLQTMDEVITLVEPISRSKSIEFESSMDIGNFEIYADKTKIKQILLNLLANAIKFTDKNGKVTVCSKIVNDKIDIAVSDTGIGIPAEKLEDIFNPFKQLDSSYNRKYEGTGLGLSIVKRYVEMHNGDLRVESEVGKGSTFTVRLPAI